MATYTTNYNLKKPAYTDIVDVADLNSNADTIDTTLKTIDNAVAGKATKATNEATATDGQVLTSNGNGTSTFETPAKSFPSYIAFCTNANTNSLDAAFGKNNEDRISGLGLQLAMYAWFKGESKVTFPYTNLMTKNTLAEALADYASLNEIILSSNIMALIQASPYANSVYNTAMQSNPTPLAKVIGVQAGLSADDITSMTVLIDTTAYFTAVCNATKARELIYTNRAITQPIIIGSANALAVINTKKITTAFNARSSLSIGNCFVISGTACRGGSSGQNYEYCTAYGTSDGDVSINGTLNRFASSIAKTYGTLPYSDGSISYMLI